MTKPVTRNLGGDRLGSGSKNNITLHNYNRSTHDLSFAWRSSMTVGTLVPFMKEIAENGDTFTIDLRSIVRTLPAIGPMFGSYKLQLDVFECPIRLYNGLLHNNMTKIGLDMSKVILPKILLKQIVLNPYIFTDENRKLSQTSSNCLIRYLGIKGVGDVDWDSREKTEKVEIERKFNAVPILAYYDIYKNYYANKQEEMGVVICPKYEESFGKLILARNTHISSQNEYPDEYFGERKEASEAPSTITGDSFQYLVPNYVGPNENGLPRVLEMIYITYDGVITTTDMQFVLENPLTQANSTIDLLTLFPNYVIRNNRIELGTANPAYLTMYVVGVGYTKTADIRKSGIGLDTFKLENIDQARIEILRDTGLNNEFLINTKLSMSPYNWNFEDIEGISDNKFPMNGLAIKTYQSDLLNNWLSTEWIDGTNGINEITKIDTSSGNFTIDALNLAYKVYNMLNRIAISGGSYEDWQEAVFTSKANRRAETPVYKGGMAAEIMFDEVINQTAGDEPLGKLAGRGFIPDNTFRGGQVEITADEPGYIIGIVSITPRVDYSDGNDWDMTELDTMDDLHKPQLDGIGFEDLLQERGAWWGTYYDRTNYKFVKLAMGKTPAWINYMTQVNKTFGDFADENKAMFMTLNRRYEMPHVQHGIQYENGIADLTTYIDPTKYNYAFADTNFESQNFWVQIGVSNTARRVMSGKIMPNI